MIVATHLKEKNLFKVEAYIALVPRGTVRNGDGVVIPGKPVEELGLNP